MFLFNKFTHFSLQRPFLLYQKLQILKFSFFQSYHTLYFTKFNILFPTEMLEKSHFPSQQKSSKTLDKIFSEFISQSFDDCISNVPSIIFIRIPLILVILSMSKYFELVSQESVVLGKAIQAPDSFPKNKRFCGNYGTQSEIPSI